MKLITAAAIVTAFALLPGSAFADQHVRSHRSRSDGATAQQNRSRAVERSRAQPRAQAPRTQAPPRAQSPARSVAPRSQTPRTVAPRTIAPRTEAPRPQTPRTDSRLYDRSRSDRRGVDTNRRDSGPRDRALGRAVPRTVPRRGTIVRPRIERPIIVAPRYRARGYYGSRGYDAPGRYYRSPRYYHVRPYVFRPRTRISLGIFIGYPVPYTYAYPYPVPVYGYGRPAAPVIVGPSSPYYGGISLEITPADAEVYVDGSYVGLVQDFDGTQQPLTVTAGSHRLEVSAPGYEPLALDVNVNPGEVVPYRGDLLPYPY